jgi:signal transduction histidine kinase/FixJ family two-component response regulator
MARIQSFTINGTRNIVSSRLLTVGFLWASVILGLDLLSPTSVASGVPYVGLVLLGLWLPQRWYIFVAATTGTILTVLGFWISPASIESQVVLTNLFIAIFAIWVVSLLCFIYKRDEKILDARTKELVDTNLQLQEANRGKSRFLSSMSHELRTPLNAVLGFADLLKGKFFGMLNDKQFGYVNQIEKSGQHLLALINELLDIAKIDSGTAELRLEEFDPREYLIGTVELMQPQFDKKELDVSVSHDPSLAIMTGDRRRCNQIMLNLLSNAIKYTPEKGKIKIRFLQHEGQAKFMVSDTGIGIEPEEREKIFSEFHQADRARDENLGGIGIGLALTRRLVEMHGGEIGVTSVLGKGSTFWFTLPLKPLEADSPQVKEATTAALDREFSGKNILIAEDNDVNLAMIMDMLSTCDHKVTVARNGQQAIDLAVANKPDLILMDLKMPVMDGLEATRALRKKTGFREIPIIGLTASAGEEAKEKCLEAGCTEHLSKPIQSKELFESIARLIPKDPPEKRVFQVVSKQDTTENTQLTKTSAF